MRFSKGKTEAALLAVGLLVAMTPIWRWASLPASPTYEEVARLICTAPRTDAVGTAPAVSRGNVSGSLTATTPAP
jgi:hypothetical protein